MLNPLIMARAIGLDPTTEAWDATRNAAEAGDRDVGLDLPLEEIEAAVARRMGLEVPRAGEDRRDPRTDWSQATLVTGLLADLCGGGFPWGAPPREDYALCVARASPWARDLCDEGDPEGAYAGLCVPACPSEWGDPEEDGVIRRRYLLGTRYWISTDEGDLDEPQWSVMRDDGELFQGNTYQTEADAMAAAEQEAEGVAANTDYINEGAPVYASARRVVALLLGESTAGDCDRETVALTPDDVHERAVALAIDLVRDEDHSIAEIASEAAAWLLVHYRSSWAAARARRITTAIGVRP